MMTVLSDLLAVIRAIPEWLAAGMRSTAFRMELHRDRTTVKRLKLHADPEAFVEIGVCVRDCERCRELWRRHLERYSHARERGDS